MTARTHYQVLQVLPDASVDVIKAAYRVLAQTHHPDHNPAGTTEWLALNEAYQCLGDPEKRAAYDAAQRKANRPIPFTGNVAFDAGAYPNAYPSTYGNGSGGDVIQVALGKAASAFMGTVLEGLPPDVRRVVEHMVDQKLRRSA